MTTTRNPQTELSVYTAATAVRALIKTGLVDQENARAAIVQVAKVLVATDSLATEQVHSVIRTLKTPKTPKKKRAKSTKPRKVTAYNMFIQNNRDALRAKLQSAPSGDATSDAPKRGVFMQIASAQWRALGDAERVRFQVLADEANVVRAKARAAKVATSSESASAVSLNVPKADWNALLGVKISKKATHECPHCTRTFRGAKWLGNHVTKRHSGNGSGNDSDASNTSNGSC